MDQNNPGILDIPVEILETIFTYLDVTDILLCTKVCKQFWNATKRNKTWEKICQRFCDKSTYVIDYVTTVPPVVEPVYSIPQEVQASVCEWRRVYMKLIQLKRNFINSVYKMQFITAFPEIKYIRFARIFQDLVIFYNRQNNEVQVWNVRTEPRLVGTMVGALTNVETYLYIVGDNIAIVQGTVLQGFKINVESGDITPMYRRLVYSNNYNNILEKANIDNWYRNRTQPTPEYVTSCVTGEYFICVVRFGDRNMLYQWNVKTGLKGYGCNISPLDFVSLISPKTYSGDILVVLFHKTLNPFTKVVCRYNLIIITYHPKTILSSHRIPTCNILREQQDRGPRWQPNRKTTNSTQPPAP